MRNIPILGRWLVGTFAVAAMAMAFASGEKASELQKTINDYRTSLLNEARNSKNPNYDEIIQKVQTKAKELLKDVNPKTIDAAEGSEWISLFFSAGRFTDARDIALKYANVSTDPDRKFDAQAMAISASIQAQDLKMAEKLLREVTPPNPRASLNFANYALAYSNQLAPKIGYEKTVELIDRALGLIKESDLKDDNDKKRFASLKDSSQLTRVNLLVDLGKKKEAVAEIDRQLASASPATASRLKAMKIQMTLVGSPAPELKVERSQGTFTGLEQYKGKVVIVDFFAHWCPPCKASYPDMRKLYDDLHGKGLEIVGVTTYYGYYNELKNLDKDTEFAKMADFIKDFNIAWPVAYGDRSNFEAYGVTGIPHVAVIDRNGKVHSIDIGYSPELFKKFRVEIEKLVNEGQ